MWQDKELVNFLNVFIIINSNNIVKLHYNKNINQRIKNRKMLIMKERIF